MTWRMAAETAPQNRVWMAFPAGNYTLGDDAESAHDARRTWAAVAHAVAEFEPVTMVVDPAERAVTTRYLSADIEVLEAPLNDSSGAASARIKPTPWPTRCSRPLIRDAGWCR